MTKTIRIPNGNLTLNESKAYCPYCGEHIPFDKLEAIFEYANGTSILYQCEAMIKCKRIFGVTTDIKGDYVAYKI